MAPPGSAVVLGVDGGGTKTLAVLADLDGRVVGYGRAGSCDIYSHPEAAAEVERAVRRALAEAGRERADIACAAYSLAGADWPEDFAFWRDALAARGLGAEIRVVNDAVGALSSDLPEGDAVMVVCGTGAAIGSRNEAGDIWHSSFWQLTEGGGELSARALHAVYRSALRIEPPTSLAEPILRRFGARDVEDLLHLFTARERRATARRERASLVPILFEEAEKGDAAAAAILRGHGAALADYAAAAARKVGIADRPFPLLLAGGVFRNPSRLLRDSLIERLTASTACASVSDRRNEPVRGAVIIALRMRGHPVPGALLARLDATFPPVAFFHTGLEGPTPRREEGAATAAS